jgi:hypothetical protein
MTMAGASVWSRCGYYVAFRGRGPRDQEASLKALVHFLAVGAQRGPGAPVGGSARGGGARGLLRPYADVGSSASGRRAAAAAPS